MRIQCAVRSADAYHDRMDDLAEARALAVELAGNGIRETLAESDNDLGSFVAEHPEVEAAVCALIRASWDTPGALKAAIDAAVEKLAVEQVDARG